MSLNAIRKNDTKYSLGIKGNTQVSLSYNNPYLINGKKGTNCELVLKLMAK